MGRGKLSLKLIPSHKSRTATFRKRTKSLFKKAYELSTLCDVSTCVLIHGPAPPQDGDRSAEEFHTWPPNREEIEGMVRAYKTNCFQKRSMKSFDLYDFFSDRKRKIEAERAKIREDVEEIKHPRWDERLECLSEHQLRLFMDDLSSKIEIAEGMIGFMEASATDFIGGSTEDPTPISENSTIDSQWLPFHYEETPSLPMTAPNHEIGFSDFLFGSNSSGAEYGYEHLQSLLNESIMENNNMGEFHSAAPLQSVLPLTYSPFASDYSQMMNNASSQVHDHPFDYSDFEYLMMTGN